MLDVSKELKNQFGSVHAKLTDVADYYLNMGEESATRAAAKGEIPFKVFKATKSRKAPWLVDVRDLEEYLDKKRMV